MPHLGDICHIFVFGGTLVGLAWPVQKDRPVVVVMGQPLNPVHPFFFGSDELNPSCIVLGTRNKAFCGFYLCIFVFVCILWKLTSLPSFMP